VLITITANSTKPAAISATPVLTTSIFPTTTNATTTSLLPTTRDEPFPSYGHDDDS
jgi:hypothetical protein